MPYNRHFRIFAMNPQNRRRKHNRDDWHDRNAGINDATAKGVGKWMPAELVALAERNVKK